MVVPPRVLCHLTDKLIDIFDYTTSLLVHRCSPISTKAKLSGGRGTKNCKASILQIWHNEPWASLRYLLGPATLASNFSGSFTLLGTYMAGNHGGSP